MAEGFIPRQRTGEDYYENERVIKRIGELDLEMKSTGEHSELRSQLDNEYGPGGWATREVLPETTAERLYQNMGLLILEVYVRD